MIKNKKGKMGLEDAPSIVVIVGLVFLIMATMAFVGSKYGDAFGSAVSYSVANESLTVTSTGTSVANAGACNFGGFTVNQVLNSSNTLIAAGNYTTTSAGTIRNTTSTALIGTAWKVSYDYTDGGTACDVTDDLQVEIANNTSIAGIILTISLVGIVLTVLIGIFLVARAPGRT